MGKKQDLRWRRLEGGSLVLILAPLGCVFFCKQCSFKKKIGFAASKHWENNSSLSNSIIFMS